MLFLQRAVGNQAVIEMLAGGNAPMIQRDYADVPTKTTWKVDTKVTRTGRSDDLDQIDTALERWEAVKSGLDTPAKLEALRDVKNKIYLWERAKTQKYGGKGGSVREGSVADLRKIIEAKITEYSDAHAVELQPLADKYLQAAADHDAATTRRKGTELANAHREFCETVLLGALPKAKAADKLEWATLFFNAPAVLIGSRAVSAPTLAGLGDFSWMTKALANDIINDFIMPNGAGGMKNAIMGMIQVRPFRDALQAKASKATWEIFRDSMPLLRITAAAEQSIADDGLADDDIDGMARAVFNAFLGDLDESNLRYATVSSTFSLADFVLGHGDPSVGAPCMVLSSLFNELFKMVTSKPPAITQGSDTNPLLTKKLADIGDKGILTRETAFFGNVAEYQKTKGYAAVNRIFFGDGHIWLVVNGIEYDPTLGIMGPPGTVAAQVEKVFTAAGTDKYKSGTLTAKRNNKVPPGGQKLLFARSVVIT